MSNYIDIKYTANRSNITLWGSMEKNTRIKVAIRAFKTSSVEGNDKIPKEIQKKYLGI